MFPILVIAIGIAVLLFGKRLAVLGGAVDALFGVGLLRLFPAPTDHLLALLIPPSSWDDRIPRFRFRQGECEITISPLVSTMKIAIARQE
jgi:hypothetical protein